MVREIYGDPELIRVIDVGDRGKRWGWDVVLPLTIGEAEVDVAVLMHATQRIHVMTSMANKSIEQALAEQKLNGALGRAQIIAWEWVNRTRERLGLARVPEEKLVCLYVDDKQYEKWRIVLETIYGMKMAYAMSVPGLVAELVRLGDFPSYLVGGLALHELGHRWLESDVYGYRTTGSGKERGLYVKWVRGGVMTKRVGSELVKGKLLSELGCYHLETEYRKEILGGKYLEFVLELEERERWLAKYGVAGGRGKYTVSVDGGGKYAVELTPDKFHYTAGGELTHLYTLGCGQLVDDLDQMCGDRSGMRLSELILRARVGRGAVREIERSVTRALGRQFWVRLMAADYGSMDDLMSLLVEVQSRM